MPTAQAPPPYPSPPAASTASHTGPEPFQPVAAVLAFLLPGAGHMYLGHLKRGVMICVGVLGLFFTGVAVGGIDCVDKREEFVWFLGQGLVGPVAFGVDTLHQEKFKVLDGGKWRSPRPNEFRHPVTGAPVPISENAAGQTTATYNDGGMVRTVSPAYPAKVKSVGRMHDMGMLFGAIAGMMNLICIIDAAFRSRAPRAAVRPATGLGARVRTLAASAEPAP